MKPVYLEFCGINSFSEKATIDFSSLLAGGVFGIFGDTGSGKSTILDCIHLALYGKIERSDGSECINHNLDAAYVLFDFEITTEGQRRAYRVKRERRRKNNTSKAYLYEYTSDGGLLALAEGTRDVNEKLESIIGLTFADFKMCIALPQGDFAALVKAATAERVKLVSRLFDLEKYGERLSKAANEKYYCAEEAVNLVKAKMEQNEGASDEIVEQKQAEAKALKTELSEKEARLKDALAAYEAAVTLQKEKEAYDALYKELRGLEARLPEMERKRREAERLPFARAVKREAEALAQCRKDKAAAEKGLSQAKNCLLLAEQALTERKKEQAEADFDGRILQTSLALEKVRGAAADIQRKEELEKKYKDSRAEYKKLLNKCPQEDFSALIEGAEKELLSLGEDDNLLDYLKHNCKNVLLGETYAEVRSDLSALAEKFPQTAAEVGALLEKYTLAQTDGRFDLAQINLTFKQLQQQRLVLQNKLAEIRKRMLDHEANERAKEEVAKQGARYGEELKSAEEKIAFVKDLGSLSELETKLKTLQTAKAQAQARVDSAQEQVNGYRAEIEKQNALFIHNGNAEKTAIESLKNALEGNGFATVEEAEELLTGLGDEVAVKTACKGFFEKYELYKNKYAETDPRKFEGYSEQLALDAFSKKQTAQVERDEIHAAIAASETELKQLLAIREKYRELSKELAEKESAKRLCDELRTLLKNNKFLEFIASEYLQEICQAASKTLLSLTSGRYFLRYEKEFKVGDNLDGGNLRAVKTLSGGETFLVSLSLALSLSNAICNKSMRPIEFFFLDEGFGTLDGKLVDTVMDVLGKLSKNFAVGLISHVEELKHRIENKILVMGATETHGSRVQTVCY